VLGVEVSMSGRLVEVRVDQPTVAVHRLTGWAIEQSVELEGLSVRRASLEDVFLELIGEYGVGSGS
jgi:ABC-2 type transport system ATP-binding protein